VPPPRRRVLREFTEIGSGRDEVALRISQYLRSDRFRTLIAAMTATVNQKHC
jgi:hypothetical protein